MNECMLDAMEEEIGHDVDEPVDGMHVVVKPGSSNVLQLDQMIAPGVGEYPENLRNQYSGNLDGKNTDRIGSSEQASTSPHCQDDARFMVSELTLENYDGKNLTIVGTPNGRESMRTTRGNWQHLYQITGGSGMGNLHGQTACKGKDQAAPSVSEDRSYQYSGSPDRNQPLLNFNRDAILNSMLGKNDRGPSGDMLYSSDCNRTKLLSKSGFSDYFAKSPLIAKGAMYKDPVGRGSASEIGDQDCSKSFARSLTNSAAPLCLTTQHVGPLPRVVSELWASNSPKSFSDGVSLRDWLDSSRHTSDKVHSLLIFRQILDFVHVSHSRGVTLEDLRPSCFKLLGSYQVAYLGSSIQAGARENVSNQNIRQSIHGQNEKRPMSESMLPLDRHSMKKQKLVENMNFIRKWPQISSRPPGIPSASENVVALGGADPHHGNNTTDERKLKSESKKQRKLVSYNEQPLHTSFSCTMEEKWYASPELFDKHNCTVASNIYCLGVLLFELLAFFDSQRTHAASMQDLRHRILPPNFLSENPKEAGFCLWLLHPEPSLRPTTREVLQSEFVSANQEMSDGNKLLSSTDEDGESELLVHFLSTLNEAKEKDESNLMEQIQRIEGDIQEIKKRRPRTSQVLSSLSQKSPDLCVANVTPDKVSKFSRGIGTESKLMTNFKQLESAYFSMRSDVQSSENITATDSENDPLKVRERRSSMRKKEDDHCSKDCLGGFFDGLCKYARFNKLKVRGTVRNGEFSNSANVMCLSFDRDEDLLAAGGVSKKIKVYEFQSLLNDSVDIHYPAVEMTNKSKLSCICWNSYIRNYLASSDYDGIVKLWDASTGQEISTFAEHRERAWSVDFSPVDPMKLASGSDDRSVKIWSINDKNSLCTIRSNANVCNVKFSDASSHLVSFTSADYKTYCYDLRNVSVPWCVLAGHTKAVSYAKFLDASTIVSASIDNTLKIWDLNKTNSNCLSRDACILTLKGHTNAKNFVGLSVADGYIACGSETNEVFTYYKSLPMPITVHKFGSLDPITGKETEDSNGQFVTSVCWRRKSNMVAAANSSGSIKLLQMI